MSDYDIHSCGYYCDRPACIERQRNELRDKLFEEISTSERNIQTSDKEIPESLQPWVKTYSGGKPNYTEPTIDGWPLWSGLPPPKKEWVGLTDEELEFYTEELGQGELGRVWLYKNSRRTKRVLRAVDDFLKEKNT